MSLCIQNDIDVTIRNVFTQSDYAPYLEASPTAATMAETLKDTLKDTLKNTLKKRRIEEVSRVRLQEDLSLVCELGSRCTLLDLDFMDGPLRLDIQGERILQKPLSPNQFNQESEWLATALRPMDEFGLVFAPLGIGDHVDHGIVRDACRLAFDPNLLCFYEDLPYASHMQEAARSESTAATCAAALVSLECMLLTARGGARMKARLAALYPSQISIQLVHEIEAYAAALGNAERYYVPASIAHLIRKILVSPLIRDEEASVEAK